MLNKATKRVFLVLATVLVMLSLALIKTVGGPRSAPATSITDEAVSGAGVVGPGKVTRQPTILQAEPNRDTGTMVSPRLRDAPAVENGPATRPAHVPVSGADFFSAPPLTLPPTE
jgi:hypothetical protein